MKLMNTTGWNDAWLLKAIRFCCRATEYPYERLRGFTASLAHNSDLRGCAYFEQRTITVKINPMNAYPLPQKKQWGLPDETVAYAVEAFILVTSHEIAHLERWDRL